MVMVDEEDEEDEQRRCVFLVPYSEVSNSPLLTTLLTPPLSLLN